MKGNKPVEITYPNDRVKVRGGGDIVINKLYKNPECNCKHPSDMYWIGECWNEGKPPTYLVYRGIYDAIIKVDSKEKVEKCLGGMVINPFTKPQSVWTEFDNEEDDKK